MEPVDKAAAETLALLARISLLEEQVTALGAPKKKGLAIGTGAYEAVDTAGQKNLQGRMDRLEVEVGDISTAAAESGGQNQRRDRRTRRIEEAVSDLQEAQAATEKSLRMLTSASLKSRMALADVIRDMGDLATLSAQ